MKIILRRALVTTALCYLLPFIAAATEMNLSDTATVKRKAEHLLDTLQEPNPQKDT